MEKFDWEAFDWETFEAELDERNEDDIEARAAEYYESLGIPCDSLGNPIRRDLTF